MSLLHIIAAGTGAGSDYPLQTDHFEPEKIPLEIINPQESLTTGTTAPSYYYRCYPGLEWRVPISTMGGASPLHYEIIDDDGLTGLTIGQDEWDADHGVLSCPSPSAGSYALHVRVTDNESNVDNAQWTFTVTTSNTIFCDSVNGDDSWDGTAPAFVSGTTGPFASIHGWWGDGPGSRGDTAYDGFICYYRTGTYYPGYDWDSESVFSGQMKMRTRPRAHIAYPGETATIDMAGDGGAEHTGGCFFFADAPNLNDVFFGGLTLEGICQFTSGEVGTTYWHQFVHLAGGSRCVLFENTMQNQAGGGAGGHNPAYLYLLDPGFNRNYISLHNNTIIDLEAAGPSSGAMMLCETYSTQKIVFEGNSFEGTSVGLTHQVYLKVDTEQVTIRGNKIRTNTHVCYAGTASNDGTTYSFNDIEICWNDCKVASGFRHYKLGIEGTVDGVYKPLGQFDIYRNTFTGGYSEHGNSGKTIGDGPIDYANNVRQYDSGTDGITTSGTFTATVNGLADELTATSGLVDGTTNLLTGANRTTYLGLKGHEVD